MELPLLSTTCRATSLDAKGLSPIVFVVSKDGTRYFPTGLKCKASDWDFINSLNLDLTEDKRFEMIRRTLAVRLNLFFELIKSYVEERKTFNIDSFHAFWETKRNEIEVVPEEAKVVSLNPGFSIKQTTQIDVIEAFKRLIAEKPNKGNRDNLESHRKTLLRFKEYKKIEGNISFKSLDKLFLKSFYEWMDLMGSEEGKRLSDHTKCNCLKAIRNVVNYGIRKFNIPEECYKFSSSPKGEGYYIKKPGKRLRVLKDKELKAIFEHLPDSKNQWFQKAIDIFMIIFMSNGINTLDLFTLRWEDWRGNVIVYRRKKTEDEVSEPVDIKIPVTDLLKEKILKYAKEKTKKGYIFPFIEEGLDYDTLRKKVANFRSNLNKYLKKIAKEVKIEEFTSYDGRHAWAHKMMISGAHIYQIMQGLGHTSIETTRIYLHDLDDTALKQYANLLTVFNTEEEYNPDNIKPMPVPMIDMNIVPVRTMPARIRQVS